jgi:anti-sigma factor RsiW
MSTTPHPFAPEEIMAHLDGELSPDQAQSVSAHIESCAACQNLMTSLRNTSQSISSWVVGSVPAQLESNVAKSVAHPASATPNAFPRIHWTRKQWIERLTVAAAAAVLLVSISVPTLHRSQSVTEKASVPTQLQGKTKARNSPPVDFARVNSEREQQDAAPRASMDDSLASSVPMSAGSPRAVYGMLPEKAKPVNGRDFQQLVSLAPGPMIARTVSLAILVKDFDSSRASLDAILARHNGYSANLAVNTPQGAARTIQASLRIPAPQLSAGLAELKSLGRVEEETQNGEEVTQQHADLVARLKNSRETEQRLQAILTQRTGKISDVLEVEQEIARVRGEIEQMEAEQKNLEHRVDFATIDLKLSEEYKAKLDSPAPAISTLIHNAAVNGYRNVADTLLSIILFFAEYGPVLAFWLLLFSIPAWLVWRRWRHVTAAI